MALAWAAGPEQKQIITFTFRQTCYERSEQQQLTFTSGSSTTTRRATTAPSSALLEVRQRKQPNRSRLLPQQKLIDTTKTSKTTQKR
jgi:hypothetical protein